MPKLLAVVLPWLAACVAPEVSVVESALSGPQTLQGFSTDIDGRERFGEAIALSSDGTTLTVGSTGESSCATGVNGSPSFYCAPGSGAAYVFRQASGAWTLEAFVKASNNRSGTGFGSSVALSADGTTLAVGARDESSPSVGINGDQTQGDFPGAGAVYVFTKTARGWAQQAYIKASNTGTDDAFGATVRLSADGSTLVVTAPGEDSSAAGINGDQTNNATIDAGAAYVFVRTGQRWTQQAYIKPSSPVYYGQFGSSLAVTASGSTVAIGTATDTVYVFERARRSWREAARVTASPSDPGDGLGSWSTALTSDGAFMVVGATAEASASAADPSDNSLPYAGAAYVFAANGGQWSQQAYVKASNPDAYDEFGFAVAASSSGFVIGAIGESSASASDPLDNGAPTSGAAYLFAGLASPVQASYIKSPTIAQYTQYGRAVAMDGAGAQLAVSQPYLGGGFVYVYAAN